MPTPKFIIKKTTAGKFMFTLNAANSQVILTSQHYATRAGATNGVKSVKTNARRDDCIERRKSRDGLDYFVVLASNKEIIGQSQRYKSGSGLRNGIASVQKNASKATVDDQA
jgi:hypothetical protein